ncbi:MAG TPA: M20/M25/M40 family metallo-hydrolase [Thermoanaerobaculia bacterium]|nr:M20/M25/M40 family metallo-hydrolase [Thermoanaerobaculia bacterium]
MARTLPVLATVAFLSIPASAFAEPVDLEMVTRIREEGFRHSQVLETARHLTDVIGSRLTGSPGMKAANDWTRQRLEEWGLEKAHLEDYPFGRGWSFSRAAVHMTKPQQGPLHALPRAYTPGTAGPVRGTTLIAKFEKESDFDAWRGKLAGKVVLFEDPFDFANPDEVDPREYTAEKLLELGRFEIPPDRDRAELKKRGVERAKFRDALNRFLAEEKTLAVINVSNRPWGVVRVTRGGSFEPGLSVGVPTVVMAAEHYNRLHRLISAGTEVELEVEVEARYHDEDEMAYNTIAEIPGTDRKGEIVMVGAHLDSWHGSTGATDNAAGCAVVMEAVRILKAIGVKPRRTIRIALWSGEEQGLMGSVDYVAEHFAAWSGPEDPEEKKWIRRDNWRGEGKLALRPGHEKLSAYFNMDNGAGRIRGIYAEGNAAVRPIFESWLAPFHDIGADTVTLRATGGTDHEAFLDVGLPGFQFVQDRLDYSARTHHSNLDAFDHLDRDALVQASVVVASFLYNAATRPEKLPRPPLPVTIPAPNPSTP